MSTGDPNSYTGPERRSPPPKASGVSVGTEVHRSLIADAHDTAEQTASQVGRRVAEEATMGIVGKAKQLTNVAAIALVAAIAVVLITVVVGVMFSALTSSGKRADQQVALLQAILDQQRKGEAERRADDRKDLAAMLAQTSASHELLRSTISENRAMTTEVRTAIEYLKKALAELVELKKLFAPKGKS